MRKQQKQLQQAKLRQEQALSRGGVESEDMHEKMYDILATKQGMKRMRYWMIAGV